MVYTEFKMADTGSSQKIVIVEDNPGLSEIYKTRLELLGYTCFTAMDGITALYVIKTELPDLVLLDLMVPEIAGDQILARMRGSTWGKDIPVFIISNLNEDDAPAGLREFGIEGYAVKSTLSDNQLDQIVDNILKPPGQKEDISLETDTPPVTSVPVSPSPPSQAEQVKEQI
jgi:DNA-binding response OmpR family regulator